MVIPTIIRTDGIECRPDCHTQDEEELLRYAAALSPLAGSLTGRHSRAALCEALSALAARLPALAPTAELLTSLNAMSATAVRF